LQAIKRPPIWIANMPTAQLPEDFDRDCYLRMNPDVASAGLDPAAHYLRYGRHEGRTYKPRPTLLQAVLGEDVFDFDGLRSVHNHDFMADPLYRAAYERGVKAANANYQWYWRVHIGLWAAATAIKLDGDFVECGVNHGFLSSAIMQRLNWDSTGRTFYLLDTFAGIDLKYLNDDERAAGIQARNQKDLQSGFYTQNLQGVMANFAEWNNKKIVVGSIPETLPQIAAKKIAFLHLDLNSTEPEVATIEYLWDRLCGGAVILLDDYAYSGYHPQKVGMDTWAAKREVAIASLPTGQGLIVKT
jgi:Macrocin-O-methyltransferase (TylF)